jgi:myo-inositol 2-dehydrogenase/D-chiro-inositol 1-dehydrogenase
MTSTNLLQIGLIGAGRIAQAHASTVAYRISNAQLAAVSDPIASAAQAVAAQYRIPTIAPTYQAILADPQIDAVLICTPTDTHANILKAAARAGKAIFCEKPIALTLSATDDALQVVEQTGVKLQIGFNRRFDANYARVRKAIASGEIGAPHILHIISRDPAPPPLAYIKTSGGIFLDMTIHDWDMARFLSGSEIDEVYVQGGVMVHPAIGAANDIDTHVTLLRFANGMIGTVDNCRQAVYGYDQRVEVLGSQGAIHTENNYPNNSIISGADAIRRDLPLHFFMERYMDAYAAEITAFVDAVIHDKPTPVNGQDGRMALLVGLAAQKSHLERRPVKVAEIG